MHELKSIKDADVAGKHVLVHTDFDVPLKDGAVADDFRIRAALPTLQLLKEKGAQKIIIISKLGRPNGAIVEGLRMAPITARLAELIDTNNIEVRENLRFDPREEANDEGFAKELAALADVFVNEAFADSHRAHASIVGIPKFLPSFAGLRFIEEVTHITAALTPPQKSLAIIGGAKFETKQPLLDKLVSLYGTIFLGGALANDLLKSRGMPVGVSVISNAPVPTSLAENFHIQEPVDVVVLKDTISRPAKTGDVRQDEKIVDIGANTAASWVVQIQAAEFVLWNGPVGIYEQGFVLGTDALAEALVHSSCKALVGGGDTAAAIQKFTLDPARVFISTGGGAMLQLLADGTVPGIEALKASAV